MTLDQLIRREDRKLNGAQLYAVETKFDICIGDKPSPHDDVRFYYKVGRKIYCDWQFAITEQDHIIVSRTTCVYSMAELERKWKRDAERMGGMIKNFQINVTKIGEL